jgi:hypothetical protein
MLQMHNYGTFILSLIQRINKPGITDKKYQLLNLSTKVNMKLVRKNN